MNGADPAEVISQLRGELETYEPDQYPVQHATARFHLGSTLIRTDRAGEAADHLRRASELFPLDGMPVEHAKATNMLGVALRELGRPGAAAEAFERAATTFVDHDQLVEGAAARYNHGLVLVDLDRPGPAREAFESARDTFERAGALAQASAAGRELGALLLQDDRLDGAAATLEAAIEHAADAGDEAAIGAAANTLGLVHLAADDLADARRAFRDAAGGHPRSVRPEGYAMAKANLALGCERAGEPARARLAARQALGTPGVTGPVAGQARGVLERLGDESGDLHAVLDDEPPERWSSVLRGELRRLADAGRDEQRASAEAWVAGQLARGDRDVELAEAYLDVLLELPPEAMDQLIEAFVAATGAREPEEAERLRSATARAMARFRVPQLMRLRDTFDRIASELGQPGGWQ